MKGLCMLAKLSLRTREPAEALMSFPLRETAIPGYGSRSRVHRLAKDISSWILVDLFGARTAIR